MKANELKSAETGFKNVASRMVAAEKNFVEVLMNFGDGFEIRLTELARALGQDGVICGHSHQAALHDDHGIIFANCGDWVDSFTAIAEDARGRLSLLQWAEPQRQPVAERPYPSIDAPGLAG